MLFALRGLLAAVFAALPGFALAAELLMVEQDGCHYCARWDAEIAPIYPKTAEGKFAPLRRIDLHKPWPSGLSLASRPVFTPTFILIEDGQELGRVEGYPGDELFWWMLARLLQDNTNFDAGGS